MLFDFNFDNTKNIFSDSNKADLCDEFARIQRQLKNMNIPVLIIIDGWESSGKGHIIREITRELDPRSFRVIKFENTKDEKANKPFIWRFWNRIPRKGNISVFDRSIYFQIMNNLDINLEELEKYTEEIANNEEQLYNDEMIIIKFFLNIKEKTQKKRIDTLLDHDNKSFLVSELDIDQNENYKKYQKHFSKVLESSNFAFSPWNVISTEDLENASKEILGTIIYNTIKGIERISEKRISGDEFKRSNEAVEKPLEDIDYKIKIKGSKYKDKLEKLQKKAADLLYEMYTKKIPGVIVFEGIDAAGKGGSIKRLTRLMDPRGYRVVPISAPNETERDYHYLWRFYKELPEKGELAIFDRSWYGRVLVERIEGFTHAKRWEEAYDEINIFEKNLCNSDVMVLKFFLAVDKEEQLSRFKDRQVETDKMYKITEEDWRNREKWDEYIEAMNEMLVRTNTEYAPWNIISGQNKKHARIKVLEIFIEYVSKHINMG
ncbi:MAG: phosphate--AMP phosphotransferase [Eubacteriales bacterium]